MVRIQDTGHRLIRYLHSNSIANTKIDDNMRSHSTSSLTLPGGAVDGISPRPGLSRALRSRHASQTPLIRLSLALSRPALVKMSLVLGSLARGQR
eukprot:2728769-Pyramimonas_sp.AAC.1